MKKSVISVLRKSILDIYSPLVLSYAVRVFMSINFTPCIIGII